MKQIPQSLPRRPGGEPRNLYFNKQLLMEMAHQPHFEKHCLDKPYGSTEFF